MESITLVTDGTGTTVEIVIPTSLYEKTLKAIEQMASSDLGYYATAELGRQFNEEESRRFMDAKQLLKDLDLVDSDGVIYDHVRTMSRVMGISAITTFRLPSFGAKAVAEEPRET